MNATDKMISHLKMMINSELPGLNHTMNEVAIALSYLDKKDITRICDQALDINNRVNS